MAETRNMTVSRIPSVTWNWLKMNCSRAKDVAVGTEAALRVQMPDGVGTYEAVSARMPRVETALGHDVDELIEDAGVPVHILAIPENQKIDKPIRVEAAYGDGAAAVNAIEVHAKAGSEATIILYIHAEQKVTGDAVLQMKYQIDEGAKLHVITVQAVGENFRVFNDLGGVCDDNARFELIQIILGGKSWYGNYTDLRGTKSSMTADTGYMITGTETLDMNYVTAHNGTKTHTDMNASGVLGGTAKKIYRGTIDLRRGAKGAKGAEMENVLLLDEGVENQTIPVILCTEEDVEGTHGASIGKLDEGLMFYLKSRGMDEDQIYAMMARARIEAVSNKITDDATKKMVLDRLDEMGA